ncbi:uncharacterized protein F5Z01DRAFT_662373 [Emericellopsis atlantica]|uniref:Uncharacterized protein n=1 Tax=Emericellopsis atlantica TaxID=2614577 RepID=A0A9P7ZI41_9HYPO|nr:uncharacterized protein F5Z01DRAFT_662373 [Emericellopsis atlantica]KAG9251898.1 hypothetical protein F5Z01DRAFT_662373 [Emericellopsis atlantica]
MANSKDSNAARTTVVSSRNSSLRSGFHLRIACLVAAEAFVWLCLYLYFGRDGSPPTFDFWWWLIIQGFAFGTADIMQLYISRRS